MSDADLPDLRHCLSDPPALVDRVALRSSLAAVPLDRLVLQGACQHGGWVVGESVQVSVLGARLDGDTVVVRAGAFFVERLGGCNCHDDPVEYQGHAVIELRIARDSAICEWVVEPDAG